MRSQCAMMELSIPREMAPRFHKLKDVAKMYRTDPVNPKRVTIRYNRETWDDFEMLVKGKYETDDKLVKSDVTNDKGIAIPHPWRPEGRPRFRPKTAIRAPQLPEKSAKRKRDTNTGSTPEGKVSKIHQILMTPADEDEDKEASVLSAPGANDEDQLDGIVVPNIKEIGEYELIPNTIAEQIVIIPDNNDNFTTALSKDDDENSEFEIISEDENQNDGKWEVVGTKNSKPKRVRNFPITTNFADHNIYIRLRTQSHSELITSPRQPVDDTETPIDTPMTSFSITQKNSTVIRTNLELIPPLPNTILYETEGLSTSFHQPSSPILNQTHSIHGYNDQIINSIPPTMNIAGEISSLPQSNFCPSLTASQQIDLNSLTWDSSQDALFQTAENITDSSLNETLRGTSDNSLNTTNLNFSILQTSRSNDDSVDGDRLYRCCQQRICCCSLFENLTKNFVISVNSVIDKNNIVIRSSPQKSLCK